MDYQKIVSKFIQKLEKGGILDFAKKLNKKFSQSEVYLVGGAARDALLGLPDEQDYDFVVRKVSAKDLEKFLAKEGKVILAGKRFGVFKFLPKKPKVETPLDIALPRKEHAFGTGGYKDVEVQSNPNLDIEEDLSRRDFTINALSIAVAQNKKLNIKYKKHKSQIKNDNFNCHPERSEGSRINSRDSSLMLGMTPLVSVFDGLKDLKNKIIRTVGKPEERFKEDYSRMLRALRFACQLNFKIEEKTWGAVKKFIPKLNAIIKGERVVPHETIAKEFLKAFYLNTLEAFELYDQSGAFKILMPELLKMKGCIHPKNFHSEGDVWTHTKLCLQNLNSEQFKKQFANERPGIELILSVLFHDIAKPYTIKTPEKDGTDRIRYNEHDLVGSVLTRKICQRLKISSFADYQVDIERIAWLIKSHLILLHGNIEEMKNSTIEKYFFNPKFNGQDLLKLIFADALSSIPLKGNPDLTNFYKMLERMEDLKKLSKTKKRLPESILNGHQIMKKFNLKPGHQIGELLNVLREEQLAKRVKNKKEGFEFLKKYLK